MKKLITIVLVFISFTSFGQVFQQQTGYGTEFNRSATDSAYYPPFLSSTTVKGNLTNRPALAVLRTSGDTALYISKNGSTYGTPILDATDTLTKIATKTDVAGVTYSSGYGLLGSNPAYVDTGKIPNKRIADSLDAIRAALCVKYTDTGTMLGHYLRASDTTLMLSPYLHEVDTTLMLNPYVQKVTTVNGNALSNNVVTTIASQSDVSVTPLNHYWFGYSTIDNKWHAYAQSDLTPTWANILSTPTTLAGYGITDSIAIIGGNNAVADMSLGTINNVGLWFKTNNTLRASVTNAGNWAFGSATSTTNAIISVKNGSGALGFAASGNGGTGTLALGSSSAGGIIQGYTTGALTSTGNITIQASGGNTMVGTSTDGGEKFQVNGSMALDLGSDATGDMLYRNSSGTLARLGIGTANQVLGVNSAATGHEYKTISTAVSGSSFSISNAANSIVINTPLSSAPKTYYLGTPFTTSSTTSVDITGLNFAIGANETWYVDCYMQTTKDVTSGMKFGITGPASSKVSMSIIGVTSSGIAIGVDELVDATPGDFALTYNTTTGNHMAHFTGTIYTGATSGTVQFQVRSVTSGTVTVLKGATIVATRLN